MKSNSVITFLPASISFIFLLVIWQTAGQISGVNSHILPLPSQIFEALISDWPVIFPNALQTFLETVIGLSIAAFLGVGVSLLLDLSPAMRNALYPLLVSSQTIPLIALAPLLLLWFGFGLFPKVVMVVLYCFFPIAIATASGIAQTDRELLDLLESMKATYWQSLRFVRIPTSLPSFFSGLKIAATYGVSGAIVGEYVGAYQGLGIYMQSMAHSYATVNVFAGIVVTVALTLLFFVAITVIEKRFSIRNKEAK